MARVPFDEVEAWIARNGIRPADAARTFGVTTQTFNGWRKRGQVSADASDDVQTKIAQPNHVSPISATETGSGYVRIRQLDGEAGMGDARINDDYPEVIKSMDFTPAYIRSVVGFVPTPGRLVLVTGRGDSMLPIIQPGESLIVDTGVTSFDGDGIYLINTGNGQQVKGLQDRGDAVYVVSANAALYPAFALPHGTLVGGKVYLRNRIDRFN
ncbi:S24 family peptidase [Pseudoxanthomonas sp.]|uniref:S24 family peptidase n=1 Tax=Pseudoxanthomonas sp. TaxID=1871049 RepID=UPI002601DB0E|nr:S24 family peptidase [Pseudoxanthomonas sp.]WDS36209.1 MAG: S24 family peptidase [Pseudoxanthomonas sp.]